MSKMKAYLVFLNGEEVDKVFFSGYYAFTAEDVKRSLVDHDGYNPNIHVMTEEYYERFNEQQKKVLRRG